MIGDRQLVINELIDAGVGGVGEFGRFVNNTKYFEASQFDEVAAAPVLLRLLPELNDAKVVVGAEQRLRDYAAVLRAHVVVESPRVSRCLDQRSMDVGMQDRLPGPGFVHQQSCRARQRLAWELTPDRGMDARGN